MLLFHGPKEPLHRSGCVEATWGESKEALGQMLRQLAPHCMAIVVISEAWTVQDPSALEMNPTASISEHPARKEGVFVQVGSRHGDLLVMTTFERDVNKKPIKPNEVSAVWQDSRVMTNFQGLFANA